MEPRAGSALQDVCPPPATCRQLHPSGTSIADSDFAPFNNNRDAPVTLGMPQHLVKLRLVRFHIIVNCSVRKVRPGFVCIRSSAFAINDDFLCHDVTSFYGYYYSVTLDGGGDRSGKSL